MTAADEPSAIREIRINPIVPTESVLIATARSLRPRKAEEPAPRDTRKHVEQCPFCTGNESMTPATLAAYPDDQNWAIRIVENLYPVFDDDSSGGTLVLGLQQAIDGYGRHEVIIDHTQHGITLQEMSLAHLQMLIDTYRQRIAATYANNDRIRYVLLFKNFGPAAGASMAHTHSQMIAMPVVPENVRKEVTYSKEYYEKNQQCIYCALIDEALTFEATIYDRDSGAIQRKINVRQYVVEQGQHFIAIKPFASRFEWEIHILPLQHQADFLSISAAQSADLARVLKRTMARLDAVIGGAQYNFFLHSLPPHDALQNGAESYHWHFEICPRTSIPNGFELGSGLFVNTISPEFAAQKLRDVSLNAQD